MSKKQYNNMNIRFLTLTFILFLQPIYSSIAQAYQAQISQKTTQVNGINYFEHTVEKGNTLYNISQTYGVSKEDILQANPALNTQNIQLGQLLLIPINTNQRKSDILYHITKKGETLYSIAKNYNSSVAEIKQLNHIWGNVLSEGQYIKVPQKSDNNTTIQQKPTKKKPYHIIRPKESLYAISKQWGVSVQKIMAKNHLKTHHIKAFDTLWIPLEEGKTNALSLDNSPFITHKVQASETLYSIARYYAISIKEIKKYNLLTNNKIRKGQTLKIPRRLNDKSYIEHTVKKRREKLSDIAKLYIVPLKKLKALNPHIGKKASRGQTVLIPLPYVESKWEIKTPEDTNNDIEDEDIETTDDNENEAVIEEVVASDNCTPMTYQERSYKIALLLPLELEQLNTQNIYDTSALLQQKKDISFKFLEFYEGAIMAAQQLSAQGLDFELQVIDIPKNTQNIASLLETSGIQNSDLIISLLYTKSFAQAAQFANKYRIPLVNTVSKRRKILYQNPYVYKVVSNKGGMYKKAVDFIKAQHANDNIIIIRDNAYELSKEYNTLLQELQDGLPPNIEIPNSNILNIANVFEQAYTENMPTESEADIYNAARIWQLFKAANPNFDIHRIQANSDKSTSFTNKINTVVYDAEHGLENILKVINPFANNMIIGLSNKEVFAIELFTKLNYINKHLDMQVIGLPHWDSFKNIDIAHTQALDLHIISSTFIDYNNPNVKSFIQNFRRNFNTEPLPQHYAFLGYDISLYFMTALKHFGENFAQCLPTLKVPLLERGLEFKTTTLGGKENQYWKVLKQESYIYKPVY